MSKSPYSILGAFNSERLWRAETFCCRMNKSEAAAVIWLHQFHIHAFCGAASLTPG